jgi:2-polyprenyl-6-methoxyphenol hydroxylase-like FAD-dependent oxidoreductase
VLGAVMSSGADVPAALAAYDAQRRPRTQRIARAERTVRAFGQRLENPVAVALRNAIMQLTPPTAASRSMAKHADWHPPAATPRSPASG